MRPGPTRASTWTRSSASPTGSPRVRRPVSQGTLPQGGPFAATLVIVRELMHHQRVSEIHVAG